MSAVPEAPATVFVVEDDSAVRESIDLALRFAGLDVRAFASGEAFLDAFIEGAGGCLVLDVWMPGINGLEVQQHLNARRAGLPIIFISAHGDLALEQQAREAGAMAFLVKPFRFPVLLNVVLQALQLQRY